MNFNEDILALFKFIIHVITGAGHGQSTAKTP